MNLKRYEIQWNKKSDLYYNWCNIFVYIDCWTYRNWVVFTSWIKVRHLFFSGSILFWIAYFNFAWKIPIIRLLIYKNNLNGTWIGNYQSTGEDKQTYEGEIVLVIRQSFLSLNVNSYTEKYLSFSYAESLLSNVDNSRNQLIYLYSQNQFEPTKEGVRRGASELILTIDSDDSKLFGEFWTNNKTTGHMNVTRVSKTHSNSYTNAMKLKK